jgi:hypothetical protein
MPDYLHYILSCTHCVSLWIFFAHSVAIFSSCETMNTVKEWTLLSASFERKTQKQRDEFSVFTAAVKSIGAGFTKWTLEDSPCPQTVDPALWLAYSQHAFELRRHAKGAAGIYCLPPAGKFVMSQCPSELLMWPASLSLSTVSSEEPNSQQVVKADELANATLNEAITPLNCLLDVNVLLDMCDAIKEGLEDRTRRCAQGPLLTSTDVEAAANFISQRLTHDMSILIPMDGLQHSGRGMYVVPADWIHQCVALHRIAWTLSRVAADALSRMLDRTVKRAHCNFMTGLVYDGEPAVHKLVLAFSSHPDPRVSSETMSTMDQVAMATDTPHWHRLDAATRQQLVAVAASAKAHGFSSDTAMSFVSSADEMEFTDAVNELAGLSTTDPAWREHLGPRCHGAGAETKEPTLSQLEPGQLWHIDQSLAGQLRADSSLTADNPTLLCSLTLDGNCGGPQLALCDFGDGHPVPWVVRLEEPFPIHLPISSGLFLAGASMPLGHVFWTFANCVHRGVRRSLEGSAYQSEHKRQKRNPS